ncbi:MAG: hypothetical protein ABR523_11455 [Desulfurivibrionaceae bacterium]
MEFSCQSEKEIASIEIGQGHRGRSKGWATNQDIKKAGSSGKEPASLKGEKRMMILFLLAYCRNGCANKNKKPEN